MTHCYYVYILTNPNHTVLYVGVTNHLIRRVWQHREKEIKGFTERYNITELVHFEEYGQIEAAIEREKQIKSWTRRRKLELIANTNPEWEDLYLSLIDD